MARPEKEPSNEDRKQILAAARVGTSMTTMANLVGVSRNTFTRWLNDYDDLEMAIAHEHAKALISSLTKLKAGNIKSLAWLTRICRDSDYLAIDSRPPTDQKEINKELLQAIRQLNGKEVDDG